MNKQEPNIKILVTYKNRHRIFKSDILTPIQTGRAIADEIFEEMIGDDSGDNISEKNPNYCELTAQYWAWKNYEKLGNPDYIGFMHYRRHFLFDGKIKLPQKTWLNNSSYFQFDHIGQEYLAGFASDKILQCIRDFDCITLKHYDYCNYVYKNLRADYENLSGQNIRHFDLMFEIMNEIFPQYSDVAKKIKNGAIKYLCNMFIMKRELFFEYNEFLFPILGKMEKRVNSAYFTEQQSRFLGFLAEIIMTVFVEEKRLENKIPMKSINCSFLTNTRPISKEIEPFFGGNPIPIALSCSNEYVPYLCVSLQSLREHTSENNNYDIIIFESGITEKNKKILAAFITDKNISLRFANVSSEIENLSLIARNHYSKECFFRLLAPLVLKNYTKIIFTDIDLLFNEDIAILFNSEMKGKAIAACQDYMFAGFLNSPDISGKNWKNYAANTLQLSDPYKYINTGVLVLDIENFRKNEFPQKLLALADNSRFRILEQDILNLFFKEEVSYLDYDWNFHVKNGGYVAIVEQFMPEKLKRDYRRIEKNPKIIHFAGEYKPWHGTEGNFFNIWWEYARKTPFYELILQRMLMRNLPQPTVSTTVTSQYFHLKDYFNYCRCRLLSHIYSGYRKQHYKEKYKEIRSKFPKKTSR